MTVGIATRSRCDRVSVAMGLRETFLARGPGTVRFGRLPVPRTRALQKPTDLADTKLLPVLTWRAAICKSDLPPVTRHVALTLQCWMNDMGGSAFPGATVLAGATGLHISTVREKLHELVDTGWLKLVERGGLRGQEKKANSYQAVIPLAVGDPSPETTRRPDRADPSPSPRSPLAVGDPISSCISSLNSSEPRKRGSRIPEKFTVTDEMVTYAESRCPDIDWKIQTEMFVNHWKSASGKNAVKLDWVRAWRNWMLQNQSWSKSKGAVRTHL